MVFLHLYLSPCVFGTQASKRSKRKGEAGSQQAFSAKGGVTWQELLGMGTMHGGMEAPRSLRKQRGAARGQKQRLSGATEEDGRESRSEAEGKIETDFLAGVEIKDEQMI